MSIFCLLFKLLKSCRGSAEYWSMECAEIGKVCQAKPLTRLMEGVMYVRTPHFGGAVGPLNYRVTTFDFPNSNYYV